MPPRPLPSRDRLHVLVAHPAYDFVPELRRQAPGLAHSQVKTPEELAARIGEADALVVSGLWRNEFLSHPRLALVQSISAGINQYDVAAFRAAGVRLASAQGVNARAVAEHAAAMLLALSRLIHTGRDNQGKRFWRPMIGDLARREDEIGGKTLLIVGLGGIGRRLARIAKAFEMRVIGIKRRPDAEASGGETFADAVHPQSALMDLLPEADVIALTCPLTPETEGLISAAALARLKPTAHLINVARGKVVDEAALIAALESGRLAAAGLDVTIEEPLPASSPLWSMPNVLITPHTAGETRAYERRVIELLVDNLGRVWRGEEMLRNGIV